MVTEFNTRVTLNSKFGWLIHKRSKPSKTNSKSKTKFVLRTSGKDVRKESVHEKQSTFELRGWFIELKTIKNIGCDWKTDCSLLPKQNQTNEQSVCLEMSAWSDYRNSWRGESTMWAGWRAMGRMVEWRVIGATDYVTLIRLLTSLQVYREADRSGEMGRGDWEGFWKG